MNSFLFLGFRLVWQRDWGEIFFGLGWVKIIRGITLLVGTWLEDPKEEGGLGLGHVVFKNTSLLRKWLWWFPLEPNSLWHKVIKSKYGLQRNRWDVIAGSDISNPTPWKAISQVSYLFFLCSILRSVVGIRSHFGMITRQGNNLFSILFLVYIAFLVSIVPLLLTLFAGRVTIFLGTSIFGGIPWNGNLVSSLVFKGFLNNPGRHIWLAACSGVFSCASFYYHLTYSSPNHSLFPISSFVWKSKVSQKMKTFTWTATLGMLNSCDNFQKRRPSTTLSSCPMYALCVLKMGNLVPTCFCIARSLAFCRWVFGFMEEFCVWLDSLISFLHMKILGFWSNKKRVDSFGTMLFCHFVGIVVRKKKAHFQK